MATAISLRQLLAGSAYLDKPARHASGALRSIADLLDDDGVVEALRERHKGIYAFLAFHPVVNSGFTEYVASGAVASDSTRSVLVLFLAPEEYRRPVVISADEMKRAVAVDQSTWGAYDLVQQTIPPDKRQPLPGVLIFDSDVTGDCALYVPYLGDETAKSVSRFCQSLFLLADKCFSGTEFGSDRFDDFCLALKRQGTAYVRAGETSFREWLLTAYRRFSGAGQDIAVVVRTLASLFS